MPGQGALSNCFWDPSLSTRGVLSKPERRQCTSTSCRNPTVREGAIEGRVTCRQKLPWQVLMQFFFAPSLTVGFLNAARQRARLTVALCKCEVSVCYTLETEWPFILGAS